MVDALLLTRRNCGANEHTPSCPRATSLRLLDSRPAALPVPLPQGHQQHGRHPVGCGGCRSDWLLVAVGRGRQPPSRLVPGLRSIRAAVHGSQLRFHCGSQRRAAVWERCNGSRTGGLGPIAGTRPPVTCKAYNGTPAQGRALCVNPIMLPQAYCRSNGHLPAWA